MTDNAGPFDGTPWAEAQWYRHAAAWAPSGVYGPPAASTTTGDLPLSVSGLSVGLGAGRAWVRGFGFERTGAAVMQAVTANTHASFSRRDRIVLRRNLATHTITPVLLTGTPAGGTPAAPTLTQSDAGSWDLPMFSFLVPPNSGTGITGLVDERAWVNPDGGAMRTRIISRSTAPSSLISSGGANQTGATAGIPALSDFTLYTAGWVQVSATFLAGGAGATLCSVYIDGAQVGDIGVTRSDVTATVIGAVSLAAGSHSISMRVEASGGSVTWTSGRLTLIEGAAE